VAFPQDFEVPQDQGGSGQGQLVGGFGGDPDKTQDEHRAAVRSAGKAPVILIHGNWAAADRTKWNLLTIQDMLVEAGYPQEAIWASNYLGRPLSTMGTPDVTDDLVLGDIATPHTNNVNEVRDFIDNVCEYLDVEVVDFITHSLGCTLAYAVLRGLKKQNTPVVFDQPQKWHRVGTFVALAGAFHGFGDTGMFAVGEWKTSSSFMRQLLAETGGGGGETPYGSNKPQTPSPAHNIRYYCGIARRDFVDAAKPGTGQLAGATNRFHDLGEGEIGHKNIKESRTVFNEFLPLLNAVPPVDERVAIVIDKDSGRHDSPLTVTVNTEPSDMPVTYVAAKVIKAVQAGILVTSEADDGDGRLEGTLHDGETLEISEAGMWNVFFSAEGTADVRRTYWVGIDPVEVSIVTPDSPPFRDGLDVMATTTRGTLYHSLMGDRWSEGAVARITSDATVHFIGIDEAGISSPITTKAYKKETPPPPDITATPVEHFVAKRIGLSEYLAYGREFGFTTPLRLCVVNGSWILCPGS
jgi:pimeloyl-ACP methyl ester carboxylesterase